LLSVLAAGPVAGVVGLPSWWLAIGLGLTSALPPPFSSASRDPRVQEQIDQVDDVSGTRRNTDRQGDRLIKQLHTLGYWVTLDRAAWVGCGQFSSQRQSDPCRWQSASHPGEGSGSGTYTESRVVTCRAVSVSMVVNAGRSTMSARKRGIVKVRDPAMVPSAKNGAAIP
jgi:hypothetical protein